MPQKYTLIRERSCFLRTSDYQYIVDYYDNPHHEVGAGGKLKYLLPNGNGTYKVTDTPKICQGLGYSALHKIKCFVTSLYHFAMQEDIVNKDYGTFIELPESEEVNATRFTDVQLELIRQNIGKVPYADYVYIMVNIDLVICMAHKCDNVLFSRTCGRHPC